MSKNTQLQQLINDNIPTLEKYLNIGALTYGIDHLLNEDDNIYSYYVEKQIEVDKLLSRLKEGHIDALDSLRKLFQEITNHIEVVAGDYEIRICKLEDEIADLKSDHSEIEQALEHLASIECVEYFDLDQAFDILNGARYSAEQKLLELEDNLKYATVLDRTNVRFTDFDAYTENLKIELENALERTAEYTQKDNTTIDKNITEITSKVIEFLLTSEKLKSLVTDIMNKQ